MKIGIIGAMDCEIEQFGKDFSAFEEARRRLAFEEFFVLQIGIGIAKSQKQKGVAPIFSDVKCIAY